MQICNKIEICYLCIMCWNNFFLFRLLILEQERLIISFVQIESGTSSSGNQGSEISSSAGVSNNSLSRHHARLQAAASAASVYGKSMVYPSANTVAWYVFICWLHAWSRVVEQSKRQLTNMFVPYVKVVGSSWNRASVNWTRSNSSSTQPSCWKLSCLCKYVGD